jgi:hypothetical protein
MPRVGTPPTRGLLRNSSTGLEARRPPLPDSRAEPALLVARAYRLPNSDPLRVDELLGSDLAEWSMADELRESSMTRPSAKNAKPLAAVSGVR